MKRIINTVVMVIEILLSPFTVFSAICLRTIRKHYGGLTVSRKILQKLKVIPVIDHYYEPLFSKSQLLYPLDSKRTLPGIELNIEKQLAMIGKFDYYDELKAIPLEAVSQQKDFYYHNKNYEAGDSELLYSIIRSNKPKRIIEIGSGYSTLMAIEAIKKNQMENPNYVCDVTCIEPYEQPWLEEKGIKVIRERVERIPLSFFEQLQENDICFIDSSHIIRPQGDVLYEIQHIIPVLKPGVVIHIHDIATPMDIPENWIFKRNSFMNEQYALETFIAYNNTIEVMFSLYYLKKYYYNQIKKYFPILGNEPNCCPGAFWMKKVK